MKSLRASLAFVLTLSVLFSSCMLEPVEENPSPETALSEKKADIETAPLTLYTLDISPDETETSPEIAPEIPETPEPEPAPDLEPTVISLSEPEATSGEIVRETPEELFATYEHEETMEYVLNKNSRKVHKSDCSDVKKIKPENYATTDNPAEYLANGYTNCGHCGGYQ